MPPHECVVSCADRAGLFDIMTNLLPIILSPPIITRSKTPAKALAKLVVSNFEMGNQGGVRAKTAAKTIFHSPGLIGFVCPPKNHNINCILSAVCPFASSCCPANFALMVLLLGQGPGALVGLHNTTSPTPQIFPPQNLSWCNWQLDAILPRRMHPGGIQMQRSEQCKEDKLCGHWSSVM